MPRESSVVSRTRILYAGLAYDGSHVIKTNGEGEPDLIGVIDGFAVVTECKQPGEKPRPLQMAKLRKWAQGGAFACWTDGEKIVRVNYAGVETDVVEFPKSPKGWYDLRRLIKKTAYEDVIRDGDE